MTDSVTESDLPSQDEPLSLDQAFPVYIGWDSRESVAADVCEYSLESFSSIPLRITMLKEDELRSGVQNYTRAPDELGSTETTFTRFLVPRLMNYQGWAIYCDCDFLWLSDVKDLIDQADDRYAVMVVKHDYRPHSTLKMDGKPQTYYPRKNWSSMMLINCGHPKNAWLTPYHINQARGLDLHRFSWLDDEDIGSLDPAWNWLVGWYHQPWDGVPRALHYTEGGPWFDNYQDCAYSDVWKHYHEKLQSTFIKRDLTEISDLDLAPKYKKFFKMLVDYSEDPNNFFSREPVTKEMLHQSIDNWCNAQLIGISESEDLTQKMKQKGAKWDAIVHAFIQGHAGTMATWDMAKDSMNPIAFRSISKRKLMKDCESRGRDYYFIDTGYFGNGKLKDYHRITKNAMQWLGAIEQRPSDRFDRTRTKIKPMTPGSRILLCPPSQKAMDFWGLDVDQWISDTTEEIKKHSDREIVIRYKQPRQIRAVVNTMEMALAEDIHCLVTFNSIAAVEGLIHGKPVFTMGPNAAHHLSNHDIKDVENPFSPTMDQVHQLLCCLAYHQFTVEEMRSGYAWAVLNNETWE